MNVQTTKSSGRHTDPDPSLVGRAKVIEISSGIHEDETSQQADSRGAN